MKRSALAIAISNLIQLPAVYEGDPQTFTQEQVNAAIAAAIDKEVKGLKANNTALLAEKDKLRGDLDKIQQTLQAFEGVDVKEYKDLMGYFQNNEEARLIKEGKIEQVIEARTKRVVDAANKKVTDLEKLVEGERTKGGKFRQRVMDDSLRAAAIEAGVHKHAVDDVLLNGRQMFVLDDEGNTVRMENGAMVMGSDGKTPFGPLEWLQGSLETKPHWFPADSSGSSSGSRQSNNQGAGGNKPNMKRSRFEQLSPTERADAVQKFKIVD